MKSLYLIDASGYLYRAYFALPPMSSSAGVTTHALFGFIRSIHRLQKDFSPDYIAAVFDAPGGKQKRTEIYADYKIHRKPTPDDLPSQIDLAQEFCRLAGIPLVACPGVEADDAIGTITTRFAKKGTHVYICTADKDLYQLVGEHVSVINTFRDNLVIDPAGVEELLGVPPHQVVDLLAMMGDASDNIPGLPGFGPKTGAALLKEFGSLEAILANPEKVSGKKKQETLMTQADLARLSKELAVLHLDVSCPTDTAFFKLQKTDIEELRLFYRELDFNSFLRELPEVPNKKKAKEVSTIDYRTVATLPELKDLVSRLSTAHEVCINVETTDVRPVSAELVGFGFGIQEGEAWYVPISGELGEEVVLETLRPLFKQRGLKFFGHDIKYDLHLLASYNIQLPAISFDTILASYLLNSQSRSHSLDALVLHYFDKVKTPIASLLGTGRSQISMKDVPIEKAGAYCCETVDYTFRLKNILQPELKERGLEELMRDLEMPLLSVLFRMEDAGIFIDVGRLKGLSETFQAEISRIGDEIFTLAGERFNLNSPKQLAEVLFQKLGIKPLKKTTTGYSTSAEVLEQLALANPIAEKLLDYRTLEKLRSTYIDALPKEVNPKTGRIHTTFVQYVAATGRLSCQEPNLQNIPIRTEEGRKIREAFRPEEKGWLYLSADYSQIELRLLAHLSQDERLLDAFHKGQDIHAATASAIFHLPLERVTSEERQRAKAVNFGIVYGQQAFGLSRELGIPMREAGAFIETYFALYPKVKEYVELSKEQAHLTGKAVTLLGRERLIPEIHSRNLIQRHAAERLAVNAPLQGTAADLIKLAMIEIDEQLEKAELKARMLLQIHDELLFEAPEAEMEHLTKLVKKAMEGALKLSVPIPVDTRVGKNWKEC